MTNSDSKAKAAKPTQPVLLVSDAAAWRAWLDVNEAESDGVWLTLAKKGTSEPTSLTYAQALDEALCSGWIDGQAKSVDDRTYLQRFTPRRARSLWSARNVVYIARLRDEGRVRPRGESEVEKAKADGRWEVAYQGPAGIKVPDELAKALAANPAAAKTFESLSSQNRYAILFRVTTPKTAAARARNIDKFVAKLAQGETSYP